MILKSSRCGVTVVINESVYVMLWLFYIAVSASLAGFFVFFGRSSMQVQDCVFHGDQIINIYVL